MQKRTFKRIHAKKHAIGENELIKWTRWNKTQIKHTKIINIVRNL